MRSRNPRPQLVVGDQDGDRSLDRDEFAGAVSYQFAESKPKNVATLDWSHAQKAGIRSRKIFDGADSNHDGTLDVAEYLSALLAQPQAPRNAQLKSTQAR